jgi:hypothetical protein
VTGKVTKLVRGHKRKVRVTKTLRVTLRAGTATVTLPKKLRPGRYKLTATFAGDASYTGATSRALTYKKK